MSNLDDIDEKEEEKLKLKLEDQKKDPIQSFAPLLNPTNQQTIYVLEFVLREDLEICLKVDGYEWNGQKLGVHRVKQFLNKMKETGVS